MKSGTVEIPKRNAYDLSAIKGANATVEPTQSSDNVKPFISLDEGSEHFRPGTYISTESLEERHIEEYERIPYTNGATLKATLTIIDTPGLNESKESDLEHMIDLVETIQTAETIKACILVVKFSAKIDQQYLSSIMPNCCPLFLKTVFLLY